jgi:hypothetical protein
MLKILFAAMRVTVQGRSGGTFEMQPWKGIQPIAKIKMLI